MNDHQPNMAHMTEPKEKSSSVFTLNDFNSRTNLTEKAKLDDEYDPFAHRDMEKSTSTAGSLAHLLKSSLGSGILAMPMAFYNAGLIFGMIGTIVVGFLCTHCVAILVRTSHQICKEIKKPSLTFAETAGEAFALGPPMLRRFSRAAKEFVDYSLMATYYAATCVYMVFIATSLHDVMNYDLNLNWDIRVYIAIVILPCWAIGQIRLLKYLVPFSAMANLFIVITFAITLYYMFNVPLDFSDKPYVAKVSQIPLFFATVIFAMEGIGIVMPVENAMRKPQHFLGCPGVLNTAMITVVVLYAIIGFFGYVRFGDTVRGSITLNLAEGDPLADTTKILMAVAILFTYGLQFYVPNDILWQKIQHKFDEKNHNKTQILLRTGIVLIQGGISAAIPNLEPFISLVGAIFFSLLGIMIPSIVEAVFLWSTDGFGFLKWRLWKSVIISILALLALLVGAFASIEEIIAAYS